MQTVAPFTQPIQDGNDAPLFRIKKVQNPNNVPLLNQQRR